MPTALRDRLPLYTVFATLFLSVTGNVLASIAVPWFVLRTTGSAAQTGITAFFSLAPLVIATFFGGTIVDRYGYKRVSIVADVASGVTILLIPLLYTLGVLAFWQLLVLVFLGTLLDTPGYSARSAMIPELAEAAGMSLDRATSIGSVLRRGTGLIGGLGAGVLVATIGEVNLLWLDGATFFVSAVGVWLFVPAHLVPQPKRKQREDGGKASYWDDLREGLRFVRADALVMAVIVVMMLTSMIDMAMYSVGLPVYLEGRYGVEQGALILGLMAGALSGSGIVSVVLWGWRGHRLSRRWVFTAAFIGASVYPFLLALFPPVGGLLAIYALTGLASGPINPILAAVMYERTPVDMRGRVFGILNGGITVAMPLGVLAAGVLLEGIGVRATLVLFGVIYLLATVSLLFNPAAAHLDAPDESAGNAEPADVMPATPTPEA